MISRSNERRPTVEQSRLMNSLPIAPTGPITVAATTAVTAVASATATTASFSPSAPPTTSAAYVLDLSGEANFSLQDVIVIDDATVALVDTMDLTSLSSDLVIQLLLSMHMPFSCADAVRAFRIDGRTLSYVQSPEEFEGLGINMPISKARVLFEDLQSFKQGGVPTALVFPDSPAAAWSAAGATGATATASAGTVTAAAAAEAPTIDEERFRILESRPGAGARSSNHGSMAELPPSYDLAMAGSATAQHATAATAAEEQAASAAAVYSAVPILSSMSEIVSALYQSTRTNVTNAREEEFRAQQAERALDAIPIYISNDSARQDELFESKGALDNLIIALRQNMTSVAVVQKALAAFASLCRHGDDISTMSRNNVTKICFMPENEAILAILDAVRVHKNHPDVALEACKVILAIAAIEQGVRALSSCGGCEALVAAITANVGNADIALKGCGAIVNISTGGQNQVGALLNAGACQVICEVLRIHGQRSVAVTTSACKAVIGLAKTERSATLFGQAGACESIAAALAANVSVHSAAEAACGAIVSISFDHPENKKRLGAAGACEAITQALLVHGAKSATVAERACASLMNLTYGLTTNKQKLINRHVCDAIISTLSSHGDNSRIILKTCGLIMNLTLQNAAASKLLIDSGVSHYLIALLRTLGSDVAVVSQICGALTNMASTSDENRKALGEAGAIEAIIEVAYSKLSEPEIVLKACAALLRLIDKEPQNTAHAGAVGACEAVVGALKSYGAVDVTMFDIACKLVIELARNNETNCEKMITSGVTEAIVLALRIQKISRPDDDLYKSLVPLGMSAIAALLCDDTVPTAVATDIIGSKLSSSSSTASQSSLSVAAAKTTSSSGTGTVTAAAAAAARRPTPPSLPPPPPPTHQSSLLVGTVAAPARTTGQSTAAPSHSNINTASGYATAHEGITPRPPAFSESLDNTGRSAANNSICATRQGHERDSASNVVRADGRGNTTTIPEPGTTNAGCRCTVS